MVECPTCEKELPTLSGMRQHHAKSHGESLMWENCDACGDEFKPSVEGRRFCSQSCYGEWLSKNRSGKENPNWKPSVKSECKQCGEEFDHIPALKDVKKFCEQACYSEWISENVVGENHPRWAGGYEWPYGDNWREMRQRVRDRDIVCQICNDDGENSLLDAHHIIPIRKYDQPEEGNKMKNLILLCRSCHVDVEHGRKECPKPKLPNYSNE